MLNKDDIQRRFSDLMNKDVYVLLVNNEPVFGEQVAYPLGFVLNKEYKLRRVFIESIGNSRSVTVELKDSENDIYSMALMINWPIEETLDRLFKALGDSLLHMSDHNSQTTHTFIPLSRYTIEF